MITTSWEIIDMMAERLEARSGPLGLKYVGAYDEQIVPQYPAVVIVPGPRAKDLHGLKTYEVVFQLYLYIYHANMNLTKRERSKADLQLVSNIEAELETDLRWSDSTGASQIVHGFVTHEEPGAMQPKANKSTVVICTRLTWRALSQRRL